MPQRTKTVPPLPKQIKEYEEKVAEMENRIIISGKKIAMETLQSSLEGIKVDVKFDNRNVLEKAFGKFDTSDLDQMQEKIDKELNRPIKEAREGIVLLIDQWDRLSRMPTRQASWPRSAIKWLTASRWLLKLPSSLTRLWEAPLPLSPSWWAASAIWQAGSAAS
ncbi:MAG: hypothetical protein ACLR6J_00465 [Parabacteroides merdae]